MTSNHPCGKPLSTLLWLLLLLMTGNNGLWTSSKAQSVPSSDTTASLTDSLTLDEIIKEVLARNDRVAAGRFMQEAAERRIPSAGAWDDPMLMVGVQNLPTKFDFQTDNMTMKMVGINQNIPYAGQKGLQRQAASAEASASAEERRTIEVELVTAAKQAYYDLYYRQLNLSDLERQREFLQQVVASSTAKLRANQASQDEVLASNADLWRLESVILSLQQQVDAATFNLNSLRGLPADSSMPPLATPRLPQTPTTPNDWLSVAEQKYPPLQRLHRQAEGYGFSARAARRMQWPMFELSASYGFRSGTTLRPDGMEKLRDDMVSFQANISLPIFTGRKQGQMARSMEAMQKSTLAELRQLKRNIQTDLLALYERAQRLEQSLSLYRNRILPASEDAYRSALAGYTSNRTSFISLLTYAVALYRDRITVNELANELARTLADAERYTTDPQVWESATQQTSHNR
jgi:cobalt-zinc-cadmium efflux system outer membrane protein